MFDYKDIKPGRWEHKAVIVVCLTTGEVLKNAKDMSRHFPEGNECTGKHDFRAEDEKVN